MWVKIRSNWVALNGILLVLCYIVGNFCLFSYINHVKASIPLNLTSWLHLSILVSMATYLIWIPAGILLGFYLYLVEYSWRVIAFGFHRLPLSFKDRYKYWPSFKEVLLVLRNALFFFFLFILASWINCLQSKKFYKFNFFWLFTIVWMIYFALRATYLNRASLNIICNKKFFALLGPIWIRFWFLVAAPLFILVNYLIFLSLLEERYETLFSTPVKQFLYILVFTAGFVLAWWYIVILVRSVALIWRKKRAIVAIMLTIGIQIWLLYNLGHIWGRTALRFLRFGGNIEFNFRWNKVRCPYIPSEWQIAFCDSNQCKGELILKTREEVILGTPGLKRPVSIGRRCILEI